MLKEESVNNTIHLEGVITPNPFDIKPLLPKFPLLTQRVLKAQETEKLEHLLHFPHHQRKAAATLVPSYDDIRGSREITPF